MWKWNDMLSHVGLWDPVDCSPPGSSVHGILQARMLESVAMPFSNGCSQPRDRPLSLLHCKQIFYHLSHKRPLDNIFLLIFSHQVISNSLRTHGLQHARPPWPSSSSRVCSSSCPLNRGCIYALKDWKTPKTIVMTIACLQGARRLFYFCLFVFLIFCNAHILAW